MLRRSTPFAFKATSLVLSGGGGIERFKDKEYPNQAHHLAEKTSGYPKGGVGLTPQSFFDTNVSLYDDYVSGVPRLRWQEPARSWHAFANRELVFLEEHDKEEWNERPYFGVAHLCEPPYGCKERPHRIHNCDNPGEYCTIMDLGNCAAHVPFMTTYRTVKSQESHQCALCHQWFYVHNRPWLVVHPDWTDEPADDEGPAFTFAEVEAEFDRDFHEFSLFLNYE